MKKSIFLKFLLLPKEWTPNIKCEEGLWSSDFWGVAEMERTSPPSFVFVFLVFIYSGGKNTYWSFSILVRWTFPTGRGRQERALHLPYQAPFCLFLLDIYKKKDGVFLRTTRPRVHLCVTASHRAGTKKKTATMTEKLLEFCCFTPPRNLLAPSPREQEIFNHPFLFMPLFTCDHTEDSFRVVSWRAGVKYCR